MLVACIRANADVFAWQPSDMPGVPREVVEHHLAGFPDARPIRQKVRRQALERQDIIRLEVKSYPEPASTVRFTIRTGWQTQSSCRRRMASGGSASTTLTSIRHVPKILFLY